MSTEYCPEAKQLIMYSCLLEKMAGLTKLLLSFSLGSSLGSSSSSLADIASDSGPSAGHSSLKTSLDILVLLLFCNAGIGNLRGPFLVSLELLLICVILVGRETRQQGNKVTRRQRDKDKLYCLDIN